MKLEGTFNNVLGFKDIFEGPGFQRLKNTILTILIGQKDNLFDQSVGPDGETWAPLSKRAIANRNKKNAKVKNKTRQSDGHKILMDTGVLRNSLTNAGAPYSLAAISGNEIVVGTNVPYAAIQNFGGTIQNPGTENGFGIGIHIKPYTITIPARPFIGFGDSDEKEVGEAVEHYVNKESK